MYIKGRSLMTIIILYKGEEEGLEKTGRKRKKGLNKKYD